MGKATAFSDAVYEVQQLRNGNWGCVSARSIRTDAVDEAKALFEQYQHIQTRVVQEAFDNTSERYVKKTIFRSQPPIGKRKAQETPQEAAYSRVAARAKIRSQKDKRQRAEQTRRHQTAWRSGIFYTRLLLVLILICSGAIAALYFLKEIG